MAVPTFIFSTDSFPSDFTVVAFTGEEKMSHLFKYVIDLKMADTIEVEEEVLIEENAEFTFTLNAATPVSVVVSGILSSFEYVRSGAGYDHYRATLVPEAWQESLGVDFEIFLELTPTEIIEEEISDADLDAETTGIQDVYAARDFTCQYNESNFNFVSRIAEHNGIYYYFDHANDSQLIYADDNQYPSCDSPDLDFSSSASGDNVYLSVKAFRKITKKMAKLVVVTGNNPEQPTQKIRGEAGDLTANSGDTLRLTEEDVADSDEADDIATIRFEEILCSKTVFEGESGAIQLRPGYTFNLSEHRRLIMDGEYLVVGITHEGCNLDVPISDPGTSKATYANFFSAIESSVQFRPGKITDKPKAISTLGTVYSEAGDPRLAERDLDGKYRVKFRFLDDEIEDKASYWLRMGQPTGGAEDAMDIPLKGGVEVQIGFENGNPDKPYIQSVMPNAEFPAHVTASNPHNALISTSGLLGLKANGGWYRRVHVDEEDWSNKRFGAEPHLFNIMHDDRVTKAVTFGDEMTEEDETSGKYIINRLYGDQYTWIDGINYEWDNQPTYSFGNAYEEVHENDSLSVLEEGSADEEVFPIPYMPDGKADREDGIVEKVWGDVFEYHKGRTFCWSEGPGMGAAGAEQVYSYGIGYAENLHTKNDGTAADVADFCGHKDEWDYSEDWSPEKPTNMAKILAPAAIGIQYVLGGGVGIVSAGIRVAISAGLSATDETGKDLAETTTLNPTSTAVEKTFGHSYSYQMGLAVDIHEGNSVSRTYGDSDEWVKGNSESVTEGDSVSTTVGVSSEAFLGSKYEFNLATSDAMTVGLSNEIKISGDTEIHLGAKMELFAGASIDLSIGPSIDNDSIKVEKKDVKIEVATAVVIEKKPIELGTREVTIGKETVVLKKVTTRVNGIDGIDIYA